MPKRGDPGGGVDPEAATLHVAEHQTWVDKKPKHYSSAARLMRPVEVGALDLSRQDFSHRYRAGRKLGEGSMGEVIVTRDMRILRDVAMKRLHHEHHALRPDLRDRFLREARVQGQLEHPSVVPVYEIGVDDAGREFFTMKRVRGRTLEQIYRGLRERDPEFATQYSRRRLMTAISRVCLAVAFAHERGVVHRDLKPANIMLGDYGEVHLLDWGIAKVVGIDDPLIEGHVDLSKDRVPSTEVGFVVGTPGYMAPEQARGETRTYGGRSDLYSLGAILFEAMTLERLHPQVEVEHILVSTVHGIEARPSVRAPTLNLPPELDDIITRATALNPEQRYDSARQMNDDIERLLDGDRDSTRRAQIAAEHTANAKAALALARRGGNQADGQHRRAVGELLQAMALEPNNTEARATMVQLLLEPVEQLPEQAFAELQEVNRIDRSRASRANGWAFLAWMGTFPLIAAMGVRDVNALIGLGGLTLLLILYTWWMAITGRTSTPYMTVAVTATFIVVAAMSMFFGPLFFVPGLSVMASTSYLVSLRVNSRSRSLVLLGSLAAVLVPTLAHLTGVLPERYAFDERGLTILPGLVRLPERATWAFLLMGNCLTVVIANLLVGRAVAALLRAERRLF
ncbi:MAG: Serine/threonine protein kinase PrkC, regulator of stationary phase, partial [Myxococcaceae bacterium]|nr:Serine/threonine protein kinase PrkC, regulator of stationary phase [Myxococcaceae bacterium]